MPRIPALLAVVALCWPANPVVGQERRVHDVTPRFEAATPGTLAWFREGFELVEAGLDFDLRGAKLVCERLLAEPGEAPLGCREAAAALSALVVSLLEGPAAATAFVERAGEQPPADADAAVRATHLLARSRQLCLCARDADELLSAIEGRLAAHASGDPVLRARAALVMDHVSPDAGTGNLRAMIEEAQAVIAAASLDFLEPHLLHCQALSANDEGRPDEVEPILDQVEDRAGKVGSRRFEALAILRRGRLAARAGDGDLAIEHYREARELMRKLGDRKATARLIEYEADVEVRRGNLEVSGALIAETLALIEGRGMVECEQGIVRTRLDWAVRSRDMDLVSEIYHRLDREAHDVETQYRRFAAARDRLARSEALRAESEETLRAERQDAREKSQRIRMLASVGIGAALLVVVAIALVSRRKLERANVRLKEEMQRATEAKAAEAKLEERMRRLELTESLGTMASGIAHDFNNLLTSILGNAELLAARTKDPEQRAFSTAIVTAGEQAARLCRKLQAYTAREPLRPAVIDLSEFVKEMAPLLGTATNGRVRVALGQGDASVLALADRAELEQVFLNLVLNAADAGAKNATLTVRRRVLDRETIADEQWRGPIEPGPCAIVEVADDGEGMSPNLAERIFDPFFTTRFPGRGLGLAVVDGVIRRHRGGVRVESHPGRGSIFRVALPKAASSTVAPPPASPEPAPAPPPRRDKEPVMIVDDESGVRKLLVSMLGTLGYRAEAFESGAAALAALAGLPESARPVVLLDLTMPEMDGPEVLTRLRAAHPRVPVVVMSGHTGAYLDRVAAELAPDAVLAKPFTLAEVGDVVARVA